MFLLRIILSISLLTISKAKDINYTNSSSEEYIDTSSYLGVKELPKGLEKNEAAVIERFVETLISSEKYLKLVETIERKLRRLDSSFHENTSNVMKYLTEILRTLQPVADLEAMLKSVQKTLDLVYQSLNRVKGSSGKDTKVKPLGNHQNDALWKEYENELNDAMMYSKKRENATRNLNSIPPDTESVIEKIMDTISSSEKYLKKVDSIDYKLNRLDIEVHDKTNDILKYLGEINKSIRGQGAVFKTGSMMDHLMTEVDTVKKLLMLQSKARAAGGPVGSTPDAALDERLAQLEASMRAATSGIESILATIAEVKSRPYIAKDVKSDPMDATGLIGEFRRALMEQKGKKCDCKSNRVDRSERYPLDCYEIQMQGFNVSGIFKINPDGMEPFYVLCDLSTAGGGWTVFQNRFDGSQDFYKGWNDYKYGFGNLAGEFWLGLEKLHYLTNQKLYEMRIELETQNGHEAYAGYSVLTIGPEHEGYRMSTLGTYFGTAGDSLSYHSGQKFSAMDVDHDEWKDGSCAVEHGGAWWYKECDKSNLNGLYVNPDDRRGHTIYWISFKPPSLPLTRTRMMIRPLPARRPVDYPDQISSRHMAETRNEGQGHVKGGNVKAKVKGRRPTNDKFRVAQAAPGDSYYSNYA